MASCCRRNTPVLAFKAWLMHHIEHLRMEAQTNHGEWE